MTVLRTATWTGRTFLTGLLTVMPLVVTLGVVFWAVGLVAGWVGPGTALGELLRSAGIHVVKHPTLAYLIGWVGVLGSLFLVGLFVQNRVARVVQERLDLWLGRVPIVGAFYGTVKQLAGMLDTRRGTDLSGMSVVYCRFGGEHGALMLGLLAAREKLSIEGRDYHVVLLPTAPVPMTGGLFLLPVESVRPAGMSIDTFTSIYVSMGVALPRHLARAKTPAARAPAGV